LLGPIPTMFITTSFAFASLMFNGDLDTHSTVYNRWLILKYIWYPYRYFNHRSFLTPGPILGTSIRLLWLALFIVPILLQFYDYQTLINLLLTKETLYTIIGLELGAMNHSIMDLLYSTGKSIV
jgi:uncharacterized metal-binding protein